MRKPIFDTIRAQRGKGFTGDEVKAIGELLDRLGFEKDDAPEPPTVSDPGTVEAGKRHTLARHLPANGAASVAQMTSARRIINGTDKNDKIAAEAMKFQKALQAAGW